ncbi:hypothetical protein QCA50_001165 [Cerrena zonata]|uniref:DUF4470 domain-containing protein n=1 Tax=Cerrena zonata TaxID=2478898 RepID=A0AAW0H028_9APHY
MMAHPLYWPQKSFFYPIGNTTPRVLTQYLAPSENGNILLLGCGDPRNVLYTLHTNRDAVCNGTISLDFTCVDLESAVLARNVVLLALVMDESFASNARPIFSIFYDFFLTQEALSLLKTKCETLLQLAADIETWNSGPYARVIRLCSSFTLTELRRCWRAYISTDTTGPFKTRYQAEMEKTKEYNSSAFIRGRSAGPFFPNAITVITNIFHEFWKNGIMSTHPADIASATHVNPMFAHWSQGSGFVAHHSTFSPLAFPLAPVFASSQTSSSSPSIVSSADIFRYVKDEFQRWCGTFHDVTQSNKDNIKIRFLVGDALHVCPTLRQSSDDSPLLCVSVES